MWCSHTTLSGSCHSKPIAEQSLRTATLPPTVASVAPQTANFPPWSTVMPDSRWRPVFASEKGLNFSLDGLDPSFAATSSLKSQTREEKIKKEQNKGRWERKDTLLTVVPPIVLFPKGGAAWEKPRRALLSRETGTRWEPAALPRVPCWWVCSSLGWKTWLGCQHVWQLKAAYLFRLCAGQKTCQNVRIDVMRELKGADMTAYMCVFFNYSHCK